MLQAPQVRSEQAKPSGGDWASAPLLLALEAWQQVQLSPSHESQEGTCKGWGVISGNV